MTDLSLIPVSLLVSAFRCPVIAYFDQNEPRVENPDYTICKQISYHLGGPLDRVLIWDEICGIIPEVQPRHTEFFESCLAKCSRCTWRCARENDLFVSSRKLGICGSIDRVFDAPPWFSVVRSALPPVTGIYPAERMKIVLYSLCLSEMTGEKITGGSVEYLPAGERRYYEIQPRDIRAFYSARRSVQNIRAGRIPKKPVSAPCSSCRHKTRCNSGPTRLSDLL